MRVTRGQVWLVGLDPTLANEQAGARPCVVMSTDRFNSLPIRQAIVVPLTSRDRGFPHHVTVVDDGGLDRESWAMCEAVRTLSTQRFQRLLAVASPDTLDAIARRLGLWLGFR